MRPLGKPDKQEGRQWMEIRQVYEFHDKEDGQSYYWDATQGRKPAEARGAEVISVYLAEAGITKQTLPSFAPDLDQNKLRRMPTQALLSPLLFVPHRGKHVCIDGWHHIAKAVKEGYPCLLAYILTEEEEQQVRIRFPEEATR